MKRLAILFLLFFFLPTTPIFSEVLTGKVVNVADGDTITILTPKNKQIKVRLAAVDTPEKKQAFGQKARDFTAGIVAGKIVTVEPETIDRYGRTVAMVFFNGTNLNEQIVQQGYGWVYRQYCKGAFCDDWLNLEKQARDAGMGLWADKNPVPPWEWRHAKRTGGGNVIKSNVPDGAGIYHGNAKSHVFHGYECQHYSCKNCTIAFTSPQEALNAGYLPHRECVK